MTTQPMIPDPKAMVLSADPRLRALAIIDEARVDGMSDSEEV